MNGFNPSAWAVTHRSLVLFLILAAAAAGALSYVKLGRAEDPSFTIKTMVFTARWPGATAAEVQDQVAERVEKKLQELPHVDRVETYTRPGFAAVQLKLTLARLWSVSAELTLLITRTAWLSADCRRRRSSRNIVSPRLSGCRLSRSCAARAMRPRCPHRRSMTTSAKP